MLKKEDYDRSKNTLKGSQSVRLLNQYDQRFDDLRLNVSKTPTHNLLFSGSQIRATKVDKKPQPRRWEEQERQVRPPSAKSQQELQRKNQRPFTNAERTEKQTDYFSGKAPSKPDLDSRWTQKPQKKKQQKGGVRNQRNEQGDFDQLHQKLLFLQHKINSIKRKIQSNRTKKTLKKSQSQQNIRKVYEPSKEKKQEPVKPVRPQKEDPKVQKKGESLLNKYVMKVQSTTHKNQVVQDPYSPRRPHLYYVTQVVKAVLGQKSLPLAKDHINQTLMYLHRMKGIKKPSDIQVSGRRQNLSRSPSNSGRKTIVFDLDETLIHCNDSTMVPHDVKIQIVLPGNQKVEAGINIRPFVKQCLKRLSQNFQLIVFTASFSCYADKVLDYIDPKRQFICHRLYREHCHFTDGFYIKDLRVINRDLSQMVLVDNAAYSYYFQPQNGIPIIPYFEGKNDYQLQHLVTYCEKYLLAKDVRQVNRKFLKLQNYNAFDNCERLVRSLYPEWAELY